MRRVSATKIEMVRGVGEELAGIHDAHVALCIDLIHTRADRNTNGMIACAMRIGRLRDHRYQVRQTHVRSFRSTQLSYLQYVQFLKNSQGDDNQIPRHSEDN